MKNKLLSIAGHVIDDMHKLDAIGLSPGQIVKTVAHTAGVRWDDDEEQRKSAAIDRLAEALVGVHEVFTHEDAGVEPDPTAAATDLDVTNLNEVNLAGVRWVRGSDRYWRPADGHQAPNAQYPFDDDGLMAWFKSQS